MHSVPRDVTLPSLDTLKPRVLAMTGGLLGAELMLMSRVPAIAGGPLELHPIVDGPRHRPQEVRPVPAAQVRRRSVLSTIRMTVGTPTLN